MSLIKRKKSPSEKQNVSGGCPSCGADESYVKACFCDDCIEHGYGVGLYDKKTQTKKYAVFCSECDVAWFQIYKFSHEVIVENHPYPSRNINYKTTLGEYLADREAKIKTDSDPESYKQFLR
tara:strand:- start:1307 stop:1672 length:366 start_codon:yes stop_codon:yes gene_type:complete